MKKLLFIVFFALIVDSKTSNPNLQDSLILSPFVFPIFMQYYDIQLSYEKEFIQNNSIGAGLIYNYKNFTDARIPGNATSYGLNLFYRYYFKIPNFHPTLFVMPAVEFVKAEAENKDSLNESKKKGTLLDFKFVIGGRQYFNKERIFFELGLGLYYRTKGIYAGDFKGYNKGFLPALLVSIGYSF